MCELFILIRYETFNTNKSDSTDGLLQKPQSKVACFVQLSSEHVRACSGGGVWEGEGSVHL